MGQKIEQEKKKEIFLNRKKSRVIEFLKPDLRKLIFFFILIAPLLLGFIDSFTHTGIGYAPEYLHPELYFINAYIGFILKLWLPFQMLFMMGVMGLEEGVDFSSWVGPFFLCTLTTIFLNWFIAIFLAFVWKKLFVIFKKRAKLLEIIAVSSILLLFFLFGLILPINAHHSLQIEKEARQSIPMTEAVECCDGAWILNITVRNHYFLPAYYLLPSMEACLYDDNEGHIKVVNLQGYKLYPDDGSSIIGGRVGPGEEKIFQYAVWLNNRDLKIEPALSSALDFKNTGINNLVYNSILLFENPQNIPFVNFCSNLEEEKIKNAIKIKIIK